MEPSRFDDLTKALATATSRRQALKAIAATTLGGILGLAGIGTAFAKCHNPGHNCEENSTCCSQNCCIAAGQKEGVCCDKGQTCQNGKCVTCTAKGGTCSVGTDCCSDTCCQGTCCGSGQVCLSNGSCATPCTPGSPCGSCGAGECLPDISGGDYCVPFAPPFGRGCGSDSDCPKGSFCALFASCITLC